MTESCFLFEKNKTSLSNESHYYFFILFLVNDTNSFFTLYNLLKIIKCILRQYYFWPYEIIKRIACIGPLNYVLKFKIIMPFLNYFCKQNSKNNCCVIFSNLLHFFISNEMFIPSQLYRFIKDLIFYTLCKIYWQR